MLAKRPKTEIDDRVRKAADILGLVPYLDRYPRQLSGGQRQRVAMGRAIVRNPQVFLFDEPLSNLDAKLRVQMRTEIKELHQRLKTTSIYVTHDQIEAMTMADKIVVLRDDLVGHRHRFDLVVRHVDRRRLQPLVQLLDLGPHLDAQLRIEIRQRLVEQEHLRIADDRASHRDALPLSARQLPRIAIEIGDETEDVGGLADAIVDLGLRALREHQLECPVVLEG